VALSVSLQQHWAGGMGGWENICDENVRKIASDERSREEHAARTLNARAAGKSE
jgi:hypothetical protein